LGRNNCNLINDNKIKNLVQEALQTIGLKEGDIVLLHSDATVVRELTGLKWADSMNLLKDCFFNVLGDCGTLIVPTFNWDFCKGKTYVHQKTRSQTGMFSNYILSDEFSIRSFHPIYSFAGIGPASNNIFQSISNSSFGENSVFHRLHKLNAKIVMFNFDMGTTFVHYVEQKIGVDYRYLKNFKGRVINGNHDYIDEFDMNVRYLDKGIKVSLKKLHKDLQKIGKMISANIADNLYVSMFTCEDLYNVIFKKLNESPYYLLEKPPIDNS